MGRDGWKEMTLDEVCSFKGGGTPSKQQPDYWGGSIPWASIKDIKGDNLTSTIDSITQTGVDNSATNIAGPGDIILATRITPGRPIVSRITTAINQDLKVVKPKIDIDFQFLFYTFKSLEREIVKISSGTTVLGVRLNNLKELKVSIPPLSEQRAIVAKLEVLLGELDRSVGELEMARGKLKVYRQSILREGFAGRLTGSESEPDKTTLGEYITHIHAGKSFKCIERPPINDEVGVAKVSAVTWGEYNEEESKTTHDPDRVNPDYFIKKGDFLMSRANTIELVGNCVIVKKVTKQIMLSDKTLRISFGGASPRFVLYYLRSLGGRMEIESKSTGNQASMRNIGQRKIKQIQIPVFALPEQHQIVSEIESRLSVADGLEREIIGALERVKGLRMGVLKKAFAGELVTEEELSSQEGAAKVICISEVSRKARKIRLPKKDQQAAIIAMTVKRQLQTERHAHLAGHVKCEKIVHLAEYIFDLDLKRAPRKFQAGPLDKSRWKDVEDLAARAKYFTKKVTKGKAGHTYELGENAEGLIQQFTEQLDKETHNALLTLIEDFMEFDKVTAEIPATVYAAWNNLLLEGENPTNEEIIYASREGWHSAKTKINSTRFERCLIWMREKGYVPTGKGELVIEK